MNKLFIIPLLIITTALTGCQNEPSPEPPITKQQQEKAGASSKVQITVAGENDNTKNTTTIITKDKVESSSDTDKDKEERGKMSIVKDKKGASISEHGILPDNILAKKGETLMLFNDSEQQVDLYTTADGSEDCPILDPTIEIQGKQTKEFKLEESGVCTIIDQLNTDHTLKLTVE